MTDGTRRRPAVFLDRDGVLNDSVVRDGVPRPPKSVAEFRLLPGVVDACASLRAAGFALVVVTNQPDIARGTQTREVVDAMNARLAELIEMDEICVCPHDDVDDCACRKPRPGMLLDAGRRLSLEFGRQRFGRGSLARRRGRETSRRGSRAHRPRLPRGAGRRRRRCGRVRSPERGGVDHLSTGPQL